MLCNELKKQSQRSSTTPRGSPRTASQCIPTKTKRKTEASLATGGLEQAMYRKYKLSCRTARRLSFLTTAQNHTNAFLFQKLPMRRFILARQLCCVRGSSTMSSRNNRKDQARLRADHRALHPTSTPSVPLAVIQPNQRCLLVLLFLAWNEWTSSQATKDACRTR